MKDLSLAQCTPIDDPVLRSQVTDLVQQVTMDTGVSPLSEQFMYGLSDARLEHRHLVVRDGDTLIGAMAIDAAPEVPVAEMVLRGRELEAAHALLAAVGERPLDVWAHGPSPVAEIPGGQKVRELLVMRLDKPIETVPKPEGVEVLTLVESRQRWGDFADAEYLRVNNEAFSWHPEQGGWDTERWERAQEADWFDPAGVFMLWATPVSSAEISFVEKATNLLGFHWTKCSSSQSVNGRENLGEIYVVGLGDGARGRGLGKFLTVVGVQHMQKKGYEQVILYVEADNDPAVAVYEKLGFSVTQSHVLYRFDKQD